MPSFLCSCLSFLTVYFHQSVGVSVGPLFFRSLKISEQIDMLGQLLCSNGIDVKINKYNILTKVSTVAPSVRSLSARDSDTAL